MADQSTPWSVGSLLASLQSSLPSPSSIAFGMRSFVPEVSFTAADGSPRYGLIALTAGVAAGAGYFALRSSFGGNNNYPYHLIAGADSGSRAAASGVAAEVSALSAQEEQPSVQPSAPSMSRQPQTPNPPAALSSSAIGPSMLSSLNDSGGGGNSNQLTMTASMLLIVLISVALAVSIRQRGLGGALFFWTWYESFPLFLPLIFTAVGLGLSQHVQCQLRTPLPKQKQHPPVKYIAPNRVEKLPYSGGESKTDMPEATFTPEGESKNVLYSGGESKHDTGEVVAHANRSNVEDSDSNGDSDDNNTASKDRHDVFASLDEMWGKSEAGTLPKTELLHAVIAELEQASSLGGDRSAFISAGYLWRAARALSNLASWDPTLDLEQKKKYVVRGLDFAKRAVEQATSNNNTDNSGCGPSALMCRANAIKFLAILQGQSTAFLGTKEGMVLADEIRKNMEKALALNPLDPMLHYMLAVWKYNVAEVPYGIRYGASWVSGVLLEADFESALVDIMKALELGGPEFYIDIHVMHAKLQMKIGGGKTKELAVASLEKACSLIVVSPSDKQIKGKAKRLLWKAKRL